MAQLNLGRVIGRDGAEGAVGATGAQGLQGKGYSTKGEWVSGSYYVNSNTTVDVVYYKGSAYYCKTTNSRTVAPSEDTEYWGLLAKGMLGGATQLYVTAVDAGGDECPEELPDVVFGLPAKMYEEQREPEVGDLMLYDFVVSNKYGQNIMLCRITKVYDGNALDKGVDAQPISFVQGKDASNCLPITSAFLGIDANSSVVVENGVIFNYNDGEIEYGDGERNDLNIWMQIKLPFIAGQGVKFETDESGKLIKVIAKGGGISVVNTEEELKSMLTEENIGSIVAYNGKLYFIADAIKVGDTLTELYFDKSWLPYVYSTFGIDDLIKTGETKTTIIQNGETAEFTSRLGLISTNQDDPQQYELVLRTCKYENIVVEQLTEDTVKVVVDGQLYYEGDIEGSVSLDDIIVDTVVYRDYEEFWANNGKPTGWLVDKLTIDEPVTVTELNGQEVWGKHISKYSVFGVDFESEDGNYFASAIVGGGSSGGGNGSGIASITVEGTSFIITYTDGTVETVEIDYESTLPATPADLSYLELSDQPIIIGDLEKIIPVASTYYKHNGESELIYTRGVIYYYDGSVFKPVAGGVVDVKLDGTSVVTEDGIAVLDGLATTNTKQDFVANFKSFIDVGLIFKTSQYSQAFKVYASGYGLNIIPESVSGSANINFGQNSGNQKQLQINLIDYDADDDHTYAVGIYASRLRFNGVSKINSSKIRDVEGDILIAPLTWTTGTSGGITLPSAGLYEVKVVISGYTYTHIVNFDATNASMTNRFINGDLTTEYVIVIDSTGVMTVTDVTNKTADTSLTISYRKIGIA